MFIVIVVVVVVVVRGGGGDGDGDGDDDFIYSEGFGFDVAVRMFCVIFLWDSTLMCHRVCTEQDSSFQFSQLLVYCTSVQLVLRGKHT